LYRKPPESDLNFVLTLVANRLTMHFMRNIYQVSVFSNLT